MVGAVVIGASIFENLEQKIIGCSGKRGIGSAKIAAADYRRCVWWWLGGHSGEREKCATHTNHQRNTAADRKHGSGSRTLLICVCSTVPASSYYVQQCRRLPVS